VKERLGRKEKKKGQNQTLDWMSKNYPGNWPTPGVFLPTKGGGTGRRSPNKKRVMGAKEEKGNASRKNMTRERLGSRIKYFRKGQDTKSKGG